MGFREMFLLNLGMLISVAYVANIVYKYLFTTVPGKVKYIASVLLMILSGWLCMRFGFRLTNNIIFDLRFVPLIIAAVVYSQPLTVFLIGIGIGLMRLTFGWNDAAINGLKNMIILAVLCALLNIWYRRSTLKLKYKAAVFIFLVNAVNIIDISLFGIIPFHQYMTEFAPIHFPISVALTALFAFILRDFQLDYQRNQQLKHTNELLTKQTYELQKAKYKLEERAEQLALASKYKTDFLANMSHELRTPLNSILNLAQIIEESGPRDVSDDNPEYGAIIHKSGLELLQLINDILDLSKVEAGRLEIVNEMVSVEEIPQVLKLQFQHLAENKGLQFEIHLAENLPSTITSDLMRILQVLRNLLGNAFKFTAQGTVTLSMRTEKAQGNSRKDWLVFEVKDTGIGIAEEKHSLIFEAFQQSDSSISRTYGGTGLGLSISRDLADLLGGFIRLHSESGTGSTFSFYLPIQGT